MQYERDHWRHEAHKNPTDENWGTYRESKNKIKKAIKEKKTQFYRKVLSLKNSKEIWKVIHRILNPNMSTLEADPSTLNEFFNKTAEIRFGQNATTDDVILSHIDSLTSSHDSIKLQKVTCNDILKSFKSLRNYCSTGHDNTLVSCIKPIAEYITSPSILPILSKVYEKQVLHQITDFIETQQVYNKYQSGSRKNHSSATILKTVLKII